jgi:hypothetical protein
MLIDQRTIEEAINVRFYRICLQMLGEREAHQEQGRKGCKTEEETVVERRLEGEAALFGGGPVFLFTPKGHPMR